MKKRISLAIGVLVTSIALQSQTTQVVRWAKTMGGNNTTVSATAQDAVQGMVEDAYSNTYVIGNFTGSFSDTVYATTTNGIHTGSGTWTTLTSTSGSQDVFLARYDIDGYCTWLVKIGGAGYDEGNAICMSNPSSPSDFFITGMFTGSMTIGSNTLNVISSGYAVSDAFVIKYTTTTTSTPSPSWWTSFGGYEEANGMGIATNGTNVFITGYYTEYAMDASANLLLEKTHTDGTTGSSFSTSTPGYLEFPYHDMFLARYSVSGTYSDAVNTYGSEDEVEGHGVTLYGSDVYITGTYKDDARFTTGLVTCNGHSDMFVARFAQSFTSTSAATYATTAGGPSTTYQGAIEEPFYKQDEGYGIYATNYGIFVTGRFMDKITFGSLPEINPSGSTTETYMYLARYDVTLSTSSTTPAVVNGTGGYSEGRGIFGINGSFSTGYVSTLFVTGGGVSTASVNGTQIEANGFAAENVGFILRVAYSTASSSFPANVNNFVDGIAQNLNGLGGTGANDINVVGYAVSYRVGCGVRAGGKFSSKTSFGNRIKTASGLNDAFLSVRENSVSVTANTFNCGSGSVLLTGAGGTSPLWTGPSLSSSTYTVTVTPSSTTTYTFASTAGSCPTSQSPVTVYNFPASSTGDAGPNRTICGPTHTSVIGTAALSGATYSWAPSGSLSSAVVAQPTATVSSTTTYTMTIRDTCGNISTDMVTVFYDVYCPHRILPPGQETISETSLISIYPNPNNGSFNIETGSSNPKDILVYDMMGKLVFSMIQVTDQLVSVDITDQPKGLYLVKISNGGSIETQRVMNQ